MDSFHPIQWTKHNENDEHLTPLKVTRDFLPLTHSRRRPSSIAASTITSNHSMAQPIDSNLQKWLKTSTETKLSTRLSRSSSFGNNDVGHSSIGGSKLPSDVRHAHYASPLRSSPTPSLISHQEMSDSLEKINRRDQQHISEKDQKILELMLSRRSQQAAQRDQRDMAYKQWEADRVRSQSFPNSTHGKTRRRQSTVPTVPEPVNIDLRQPTNIDHRISERPRTICSNIETVPKCKCDLSSGQVCSKCNTPVRRERELQRRQYDRKIKDIERKKRQEERKKQAEQEQEDLARKIEEQQQKVLKRAKASKEIHAQEQILKTKVRNLKTKIRHESILKEKLQIEREEKDIIISKIQEKQISAEIKRDKKKSKNVEFRHSQSDLLDRMEKSKQRKEDIDNQMLSYREDLQSYLSTQEQRASDSAKNQLIKKKQRASSCNSNKSELQRKNLARLMEQEKDWKSEVEADIALKDSRIKNYQIEKQEKITMSREMASTSRLLRDQLKCHYSMNDLDKNYL